MKRVLMIFALLGAFTFAVNAQQMSCCAGKKASSSAASCSKVDQATLDKAASADGSIVKQVSNTGEVSYARKAVDAKTGQVSFTEVEYCTKVNKFINVSPTDADHAACAKDGEANASNAASTGKSKSCCSGAAKKACCADGKKADSKASSDSKSN